MSKTMKIIINDNGSVECDGKPCEMLSSHQQPCLDCTLHELFKLCYMACDPLQCRKILCAGCEFSKRS